MKNNNGASIRKLSSRSLKNNSMRNTFAIMAITLTCTLFTAAFSLLSGAIQKAQETTMHEVGTRSHVGLKAVTTEQYEKVIADPLVKKSGYNIFIGRADNILKRQAELRYTPYEENLSDMFIELEEGHLPVEKNEIIVDTIIMDELRIPYALGEKVPLTFTFMDRVIEDEFIVSGYYKGDNISHASELFLSESYWTQLKGSLTDDDFKQWEKDHPNDNGVGLMAVNIYLDNDSNLEEKITNIIINAGYEPETELNYGVNWAYMGSRISSLDPITFAFLILAVSVIFASGYLIIYNIFQISVINDIRFYGLLKTIGTTKKQIRRLISHQAVFLSIIGIPIGLLIGFLIGKAALPIAMSFGDTTNIDTSLEFNPFIMVFGAVFSAFTVFLSCRKPGKIAGNVSPIEAVKYTDSDFQKRHKKRKRSSRFSAVSMALSNLGRNKRTTVVVTAAISLSIILLAIIMTAVRSFRLDQYIEQRIVGDFLIGNVNITAASPRSGDLSIDEEYLSLADSQEGIESINKMWVQYATTIKIDENAAKAYRKLDEEGKLRRDKYTNVDGRLTGEDPIDGFAYKYDTALFDNLKVIEGSLDVEKFQNGKYILLGTMRGEDSITEHDHVYHPGDKVVVESATEDSTVHEIKNEAGETIDVKWENLANDEYEVMAIVDIPASMNIHRYPSNACDFILPLQTPALNSECFAVSYQIADEYQDDFENAIKYYSENVNRFMGYMSKESIANEFNSMLFAITSIGIALAATIALIGILNFINAMITEIIARKREFAMLQSIGMTNAQLKKTLICEGIAYIVISASVSFVLGSLLSWKVLEALNNVFLFFEYRFQLLPFIITLPILLLVAILAPLLSFKQLKKKSIVERLRESE